MNFVFFVLFPLSFVLYVMLVFFGYSIGISKSWPGLGEYGAITSAVFVGMFVWLLAILVARIHLSSSGLTSKALSRALFIVLYLLSGFGIANYLFYQWEGPTVLRQAIERAETRVTSLQNVAGDTLVPKEYLAMQERIGASFSQLVAEIRGGIGYCGIGTRARLAIAEIARDLPNFRELAGTDNRSLNCANKDAVEDAVNRYRAAMNEQLQRSTLSTQSRVPERQSLLARIVQFSEKARTELAELRGVVSAMSSKAHNESADFAIVLRKLEGIEAQYTDLRQQLFAFVPASSEKAAATFELTSARTIGSFTATIDVILQRIARGEGHVATILYLAAPLLMDLMIVFLIVEVLRRPPTQRTSDGRRIRYLLPPLPVRKRASPAE
jgi:hypothetical protein